MQSGHNVRANSVDATCRARLGKPPRSEIRQLASCLHLLNSSVRSIMVPFLMLERAMSKEAEVSEGPSALQLTCRVLTSYLRHDTVPADEVPGALRSIYKTFISLTVAPTPAERTEPAVPIKKSVTRNYIICLKDGRKLKMLKRYLRAKFSMTPDQYRAKWHLPSSYPMVAPAYAERRSALAKNIGLGGKR